MVDSLSLVRCIVLVPLMWSLNVHTWRWAVGRAVVLAVVWLRAITWLRVFRKIRYLITMVLQVFYDMLAYLAVLSMAVFGLAYIWRLSTYLSHKEEEEIGEGEPYGKLPTFYSSLHTVTMIIFGSMVAPEEGQTEFSMAQFVVAILFGIALSLAMLNLLIAIISQTYSVVEENRNLHDLREVISLIIDFNGSVTGLFNCSFCQRRQYVLSIRKTKEIDKGYMAIMEESNKKIAEVDQKISEVGQMIVAITEKVASQEKQ